MSRNVLLVGSSDRHLEELLRAAGAVVKNGDARQLAALAQPAVSLPHAVVLDLRDSDEFPADLTAVKRQHPALGVIVVAAQLDPAVMLQAMRAGVNEFLTAPVKADDVLNALERVSALEPRSHGQVFAFLGAKGGVGTTTVAVNVATSLAQSRGARVLLVDLHPAYGDAALFFGVEPRFSVLDAFENTHRLDEAYLKGLVAKTKVGLDLLASSDRSMVVPMDSHRVHTLIDFVGRHYTHVVLDVPRSDAAVLDALEGATTITVVANQELSTVRAAARMATTLRQRYGRERVLVVVSRYDTGAAIGQDDVERATGGTIRHTFPSDYRLAVDALNRGCPLVVENHSKLAGSIAGFARSLSGIEEPRGDRSQKSGGLLGRFTGRR